MPVISVVIPVLDGGEDLARCLDGIDMQTVRSSTEVIVVDSGSRDGSRELAAARGARVVDLPSHRFTHGLARNTGVAAARGEVIVLTSQDAVAVAPDWLEVLAAAADGDPDVAGAYGRQLPHPGASPPEQFFLDFLHGTEPRRQRRGTGPLTFETTLFSNVNAAIPRRVLDRFPFAEVVMSEDQEWSRRVLAEGLTVVYEPRAAVRHSHAYTIATAFRRFFDSGMSAEYSFGADAAGRTALRGAASRYAVNELRWLARTRRLHWLPYVTAYELAKWAGLQLGLRHQRLPPSVVRRWSSYPARQETG